MAEKPNFCSECGAKLTGSAAFCPNCGAKQVFAAAAPVVTPAPAPAPVVTPAPAPVAEPVVVPAPVPAAAPENSLAAKKSGLSVPALILAIAAICCSLLASAVIFLFHWRNISWQTPNFDVKMLIFCLRRPDFLVGLFTGLVVPAIAIVMVLLKKKPAALVGLILIAVFTIFQLWVAIEHHNLLRGNFNSVLLRLWPFPLTSLTNMVNGEDLFRSLSGLFRGGRGYFLTAVSAFFFHLKNYLAIAACLMTALKKK